jgi:hypothetical protein
MNRAFRALAIAVAAVTLSGCNNREKPAAVAAAEPKSVTAPVEAGEAGASVCAETDIDCQERLYQLEETLFAYEGGVAKQLDESAKACWNADSAAFRRSVDGCDDFACKDQALLARIASLHFLQPIEHRASLQFPESSPSLLTVLPPDVAADSPPVPPDAKLEFEARGSLIHAREHPEHMGIAVSADGKDHVFLYDMDIGGRAGQDEVLGLVGTSPTAKVLVRGQRLVAPTGTSNFDPAQCRWVYELP